MAKSRKPSVGKDSTTPPQPQVVVGIGRMIAKKTISLSVSELAAAVGGDRRSAVSLLFMARALCSAVEDFRQHQPDLANEIARKLPDWPALVGRHKASVEKIGPILEGLELGRDHPSQRVVAPESGGINLNSPKNSVAEEIWQWMNRYRRPAFSQEPDAKLFLALPEFSRDTFDQWWEVGWSYWVASVGGDPFLDLRLQRECGDIERTANAEGVTIASRVATEVRRVAKKLWPQLAGLPDKTDS